MSTVSALLRTVVRFRVCVWDSISNADGIAGGNALPHARACVKQTTNLDTIEVHNTSCACVACNPITCSDPVGARGVVGRNGISCVCSWLVCGW